jgi:hypothetical protein
VEILNETPDCEETATTAEGNSRVSMGFTPLLRIHIKTKTKTKKTQWLQPESELNRPSDHSLSTKLVPTLRIEVATWSAWQIPTAVFSVF